MPKFHTGMVNKFVKYLHKFFIKNWIGLFPLLYNLINLRYKFYPVHQRASKKLSNSS